MTKLLSLVAVLFTLVITGCEGPTTPDPLQGPPGPTGPAGANGLTGPTGPAGEAGAQGLPGLPGAAGERGPAGVAGPAGANGANGQPGPQGVPGQMGPQGPQGVAGAKGADGAKGATGPTGPTGLTGPAGAKGADGAAGLNGTNGKDGVCTCTSQSKIFTDVLCDSTLALATGWINNADGSFKDVQVQVFIKNLTEWQNFPTFALTTHDAIDLPPYSTSSSPSALTVACTTKCTYRVVVSSCSVPLPQ